MNTLATFEISEFNTFMTCWEWTWSASLFAWDIDASCGIKGTRSAAIQVTKARPAALPATEQGCSSMVAMLAA